MMWHAFLFLGLRPVGLPLLAPFCLMASTAFSCNNNYLKFYSLSCLLQNAACIQGRLTCQSHVRDAPKRTQERQ
jgi:hypothetical protein